jgi:predicted nuclease of predicted toxin-antitoxin system
LPTLPKFLTDVHVSKIAIKELQRRGVDIVHCEEAGLGEGTEDEALLIYAIGQGRIVVSCDSDFLNWDAVWKQQGKEHAGIVKLPGWVCSAKDQAGILVNKILFLHEAALVGACIVEEDLYNKIWRA